MMEFKTRLATGMKLMLILLPAWGVFRYIASDGLIYIAGTKTLKSEIDQFSYEALCSTKDWNSCKGKQVVWEAKFKELINTTTIRSIIVGDKIVDVHFTSSSDVSKIRPDQIFKFVGHVAAKGWIYDDIESAKMLEISPRESALSVSLAKADEQRCRSAELHAAESVCVGILATIAGNARISTWSAKEAINAVKDCPKITYLNAQAIGSAAEEKVMRNLSSTGVPVKDPISACVDAVPSR